MIWDKLVDRCLLFTNSPGGLIKELLKEAEMELANRLEIYDAVYQITVPSTQSGLGVNSTTADDATSDNNYTTLPYNYIRDISVVHKGYRLRKLSEDEIYRMTDGEIPSGTPTAYGISGDFIVFDKEPAEDDTFILHYKANLDGTTTDKVLTIQNYVDASTDQIYLGTPLGAALDGLAIYAEANAANISNGTVVTSYSGANRPAPVPDRLENRNKGIGHSSRYDLSSPMSSGSGSGGSSSLNNNWDGALATVINYRNIAPLIPDRFHINLCDYAIAIANAKTSPAVYDKYWTMWELNMERLDNQARDRDLIHSVREEI